MISSILIAAFGNPLAGDDAFGLLVAERLQSDLPPDVQVLSAGQKPGVLLTSLAGVERLVVVDAALAQQDEPNSAHGDLLDVDYLQDPRPTLWYDRSLSTHGLGVAAQLALAERLGILPKTVRVIATSIVSAELGAVISPAVAQAAKEAAERIRSWVQYWNQQALGHRSRGISADTQSETGAEPDAGSGELFRGA